MPKLFTRLCIVILLMMISSATYAQRRTDVLDRGLVAVPIGNDGNSNSNFVSWRRLANEYYDVTYNLYKGEVLLASGLTKPNYTDGSNATINTEYQVAAVVRGVEQQKCAAVKPWKQYVYNLVRPCPTGYIDIPLAKVYDRNGTDVTANYEANDATMADLDGDGDLEMIIKRVNTYDTSDDGSGYFYRRNSTQFVVIDAYDIDWSNVVEDDPNTTDDDIAKLLWRIDCGPNMVSHMSTEINIIAYDWDGDGKAEVVFRGVDNMIVYGANGITRKYVIGDASVNTRPNPGWLMKRDDGTDLTSMAYTNTGAEYLVYMNGLTAELYETQDFPLKRLENNETDLNAAWGDGYGHRSSKYFMGAPYLDGRKPSLFFGRGIYTRHKMIAMNLAQGTHHWTTEWTWNCNNSNSPWYGNGYHNFVIADVDEDGRDEIVYGSMVIDDNGKGLSTTGFQHGDAQHVSDFDPYRKGLEFFGCLEDGPYFGSNYRNATTSEVYFKHTGTKDDGRGLMANFSDDYPGSIGRSVGCDFFSGVTDQSLGMGDTYVAWSDLNFRIYWDGDLCSEILNSTGTGKEAKVDKPGVGRLFTSSGCNMNNGSKNNACFQGDIIGDWREEIVVRCGTNVRVYTSGMDTDYDIYSLWYDHQYRQAMVWQMMAYNQPPHLSCFLGEVEGFTVAPPPYTNTGRTEITNAITTANNGQHVMACAADDMEITVADGASPWVFTDNAPSWVQGTDVNGTTGTKLRTAEAGATNLPAINTSYYTHTLTGGAFTGAMHLAKQGDGTLVLPNVTETYTGNTNVWAGTLEFNGTMQNSPVWLNRFATLSSTGGVYNAAITAEYAASILPGGAESNVSTITANTLDLHYGARVVLDLNGANVGDNDQLLLGTLAIGTKSGEMWKNYGPEYLAPVFEFHHEAALTEMRYPIGTVDALAEGSNLSDIIIEGVPASVNPRLEIEDGTLYLVIDEAEPVAKPLITIVSMEPCDLGDTYLSTAGYSYYFPKVAVTAEETNGTLPTLTGTFTDLQGNVTTLGGEPAVLFSEDFEGSTTVSDYWKNSNEGSSIYSPTYANSSGQCIGIQSASDRGDFTPISANYAGVTNYTMEFDAYFNNASKTTDFAVMSRSHAETWVYNWGYDWFSTSNNGHNPYLLFLRRGASSTTFTINESEETVVLSNSTWYHFTLNVDVENGVVEWSISPKGSATITKSGAYTLLEGESAECDGIYIRNGRYNYAPGGAGIDNILIQSTPQGVDGYTFTEPGTLEVTASADGYADNSATFTVEYPYVIDDEDYQQDYEEATDPSSWSSPNAADQLFLVNANGNKYISFDFNSFSSNSRSASTSFDVSGISSNIYSVQFDASIQPGAMTNTKSQTSELTVMAGGRITNNANFKDSNSRSNFLFDVSQVDYTAPVYYVNGSTTETVTIPSGVWCRYQLTVNVEKRTVAWVIINKSTGEKIGEGAYELPQGTSTTATGLYFLAGRYFPVMRADNIIVGDYLPVAICDELYTLLPQAVENGNAHLWRGNLTGLSTWATMVLPFDLTNEQVKAIFGENTVVANILTTGDTETTVEFETTSGAIQANVPFMIQGVTNSAPYLIRNVTGTPDEEPKVETNYFQFLGNYESKGAIPFTTSDYFFTTTGNRLSTVSRDGVTMTLNGYRAYFHSKNGFVGSHVNVAFDSGQTGIQEFTAGDSGGMNVYNPAGQLIRRNASSLRGLPKGVYVVNGKTVIVK